MATISADSSIDKPKIDEVTYRKRIRAWTLYDWANSAFVTTVTAAVLPAYYSAVAGSTLPSAATATAYWGITNSIALFIVALLSPILGTVSDVMRGKKLFLSIFTGIGIIGSGFLVLISTGDWLLASLVYILGRVGFAGAIVFYDALLPHVARDEDQDKVSTKGYAWGYIGGGILLAINVVMIQLIPDTWFEYAGIRLSFLSVAIWWLVFSIPIFRDVPEPPGASESLKRGESVIGVSFARMGKIFSELSHYRDLFKYLIAFLIYNDAINTIIGIAVIYGAELGFATLELVLALLMVQFVGVPFTLVFGNLPRQSGDNRRHYYLAFVLFNAFVLPLAGIIGAQVLSPDITGIPPEPYITTDGFYGEGTYAVTGAEIVQEGTWQTMTISPEEQVGSGLMAQLTLLFSAPEEATYIQSSGGVIEFPINGQRFELNFASAPENAVLAVEYNGTPLTETVETETGEVIEPVVIDTQDTVLRYGDSEVITLPEPGQYTVRLIPQDANTTVQVTSVAVLPPVRSSNLPMIFVLLLVVQAIGAGFAFVFGRFFKSLSDTLDTRRSILVSLLVYCIIAVWGFFLKSTIEFWYLAWMVAIVQGGSQALSRSLYASMCPPSKSGEFFGLFSIMSKFASIIGPLLFAAAVAIFGNSRPAILSLIALFVLGGFLLMRVNIEAGQRLAKEEDAQVYGSAETPA
jgi:MFS transporter, UMF1 family